MAKVDLKGKTITIDDELYDFMTKRFWEFNEDDCMEFIRCALTTGDLHNGFKCPDLNLFIEEKSEAEISAIMKEGINIYKRHMA